MSSMRCKRCNGSSFERDDVTGNSNCGGCGLLQPYDSYEAPLGRIRESQGTYVRAGTTGLGSVLPYREKKIYEANNSIEDITERLKLGYKAEEVKSMIKKITDGEFGQGEWFSILIGACCYAVVRKEGKYVLPMEEIAVAVGCDLRQLGSMFKDVAEYFGLESGEFDLVGLFTKTMSNSSRLSGVESEKRERITKQGAFLMNCSLKWFLSTGRRPMPLVVAVLAFVCQVNGVKVKIDDLARDAQVALTTCKARYKELSEMLVKVAKDVPWAKDVTVKNVVKHSGNLLGFMENKSMKMTIEGKGDELVRSDGFCLEDIVRDCLSKEAMYYDDDGQDNLSRYFDVGAESQLTLCNNDDNMSRYLDVGGDCQLSSFNNDGSISAQQLTTMNKEFEDGVCSGTLSKRSQENDISLWQRRSVFQMIPCEDWWKGKSKLSQRLSHKEVLEKDVGLDALPPSYIKGCSAVGRRREKVKAAKLRINAIQHPSDIGSGSELSSELEHIKKKRKIGSEIDWEDLVIQRLVLHDVNNEEIEKGYYNALLDLHVFNSVET